MNFLNRGRSLSDTTWLRHTCGGALFLLWAVHVSAAPSTNAPYSTDAITQAIADLGHDAFERREAASLALWHMADAAEQAIRAATHSQDPEVALRAQALLTKLDTGLRPNTSAPTKALLLAYPRQSTHKKSETLLQLLALEDAGPSSALRLLNTESSADVRRRVARPLHIVVRDHLARSLIADAPAMTDTCLRLAMMSGDVSASLDYVAFHSMRNTLAPAILALEAEMDSPHKWHTLALAHRANHDLAQALEASQKAGMPALTRTLREEKGEWATLLQDLTGSPKPNDVFWLGDHATYLRLAGHTQEHTNAMNEIMRHVRQNPDGSWYATEALILNDSPERAITVLGEAGLYDILARLLFQRRDFDRLLEFADQAIADKAPDADIRRLTQLAAQIRDGKPRIDAPPPNIGRPQAAPPQAKTVIQQADEALTSNHLPEAIRLYRDARDAHPRSALPIFLEGLTRLKVDATDADARRLVERATRLPLAQDAQRISLAGGLARRGFESAALDQWQLLWQYGAPDSAIRIDTAPHIAALKANTGQHYTEAANDLETTQLQLLRKSTSVTGITYAVAVRATIARYRALAAIKAGDIKTAQKHIAQARHILPYDIELVIDVRAALSATEHAEVGQTLFDTIFGELQALCRKHSRHAELHNEAAWLAARCRMELAAGEVLARRAVSLVPGSVAYLDTLAEILFQQQKRENAISLMQKCVDMEPDAPYFQRQLKRFQTGSPSTDPEE